MKKKKSELNKKLDGYLQLGRPSIAFGLESPDKEILKSLNQGKKFADITLVGGNNIKDIIGFKKVIDKNPENKIAKMLAEDKIEGIIRGTLDDFKTYEAYEKITGEKYTYIPGLLEDNFGRQFFVTSISNPEGWKKQEKLKKTRMIADFIKDWGITPQIAVFSGVRHETYLRKKQSRSGVAGILNRTYEDAEWIVGELRKNGYEAKHWAIDINPAIENGANVIVPANGMVGNQILKVLLLCGGKLLTGTRMGLSRFYEDNSRTEKDFLFHIKWLVALINKSRK